MDTFEDQLAKAALAASPLSYEHDDKENILNGTNHGLASRSPNEISVTIAAQYERSNTHSEASSNSSLVSYALYNSFEDSPQPYGLGGGDGTGDETTGACTLVPPPDVLRLLATSEGLPLTSTLETFEE